MVRPRISFVVLKVCWRTVEQLVPVNSKLSSIGVILHSVFWAVAVRLYCQLLELFLLPEFSLVNDAAILCARKEHQRRYFNRGNRVLSSVKAGESIWSIHLLENGNQLNASEQLLPDLTRF